MGTKSSVLLDSPEIMEGIGPLRSAALTQAGITTIAAMIGAGVGKVRSICPDAGESEVRRWLCAAALLRIKGMTPALADALARAQVCSSASVADAKLKDLEDAVKAAYAGSRAVKIPSIYDLAAVQQAAWKVCEKGMMAGRILTSTGAPLAQVRVDIGSQEALTNDAGWVAFDAVPVGKVKLQIYPQGRSVAMQPPPLDVSPDGLAGPVVVRIASLGKPEQFARREIDGYPVFITKASILRAAWREIGDLPEGDLLQVRDLDKNGVFRLLSLYKERQGTVITVFRTKAGAADLPAGTKPGDIVTVAGGRLQSTKLTVEGVSAVKREKTEALGRRTSRRVVRLAL